MNIIPFSIYDKFFATEFIPEADTTYKDVGVKDFPISFKGDYFWKRINNKWIVINDPKKWEKDLCAFITKYSLIG
jgi:hypothetical protein